MVLKHTSVMQKHPGVSSSRRVQMCSVSKGKLCIQQQELQIVFFLSFVNDVTVQAIVCKYQLVMFTLMCGVLGGVTPYITIPRT